MSEIKKICISRLDKMGDMILSLPAIKAIKVANPNIYISVLASSQNAKVLKGLDYIDKINIINNKVDYFDICRNLLNIRKIKFDYYLNLSPTFLSYFFCFFANAKKKGTLIFLSRYKKTTFSKLFTRFFSIIFCHYTYVINRYSKLINNQDIHQTNMIFNLFNICSIAYDKNINTEIFLPKNKLNLCLKNQKLITIHLTDKWLNRYYSEDKLINLIKLLPKNKYKYVITTDNSSNKKFEKIFQTYNAIKDKDFMFTNKLVNEVTILDRLKYENWLNVIYSSVFVITPECGCSHISAACKVPVIIIYDADNLPNAIHKEYHPWKSIYKKLIFNDEKINEKIISFLT